ncbi:acyl-CoA thioesterase [Roseobacteraceae bacterium S113]
MYPILRMTRELIAARSMPKLGIWDTHVSHHRVWLQDIDTFLELNNGRTLTLLDVGRIPMAARMGLIEVLRREKWALTMAGCSVRWRRRLRPFEAFEMRSRGLCYDEKFMYIEQSMWKKNGECANHVLYRSAVTDKNGIVAPVRVLDAMGLEDKNKPMPEWVRAWIEADAGRPWPPMTDATSST